MVIKVQYKTVTVAALIESGFDVGDKYLTYYLYSQQAKATFLEKMIQIKQPFAKIYFSLVNEKPRDGEWMEDLDSNAKEFAIKSPS